MQGRTALHIAAFKAEPEIVQLLIDSQADPTIADARFFTAKMLAERTGNGRSAAILHQAEITRAAASKLLKLSRKL